MVEKYKGYSICPVENRGALLLELISRYYNNRAQAWNKKIVIVFSNDNSVKYFQELFMRLRELPVMPLLSADLKSHNGKKDLALFTEAGTGAIAITTDVAVKKMASLEADTIIQFAPPKNIEYINEISAMCELYLLFVRPQEISFIEHLQEEYSMELEDFFVPWKVVKKLPEAKIQLLYSELHSMNINSKGAYKGYMDALRDHELKSFYNLDGIDIKEVAEGYCLSIPPYYKMQKETSRYETERKRKDLNMAEKAPSTAKRVVNSYDSVKETNTETKMMSKLKGQGLKVVDGVVQFSKFTKMSKSELQKKRKKRNDLIEKVESYKALRKQLKKIPGGSKIKLPVPGKRR